MTCAAAVVRELSNKVRLARVRAPRLGLEGFFPKALTLEGVVYPCVLKKATGEFGSAVRHATNGDEFAAAMASLGVEASTLGEDWLLQELVASKVEYSASLLVFFGRFRDVVRTTYTYDEAVYVWPRVSEDVAARRTDSTLPPSHLECFARLLHDFTGICNVNYKVRDDGRPVIFEINPRLGADLACHCDPPARLRLLLERLDGAFPPSPRLSEALHALPDTRPRQRRRARPPPNTPRRPPR